MKRRIVPVLAPKKAVLVGSDDITFGRDASNTFCLDDLSASRFHAMACVREEQLVLKDLGGRNGTYVIGDRLPPKGERILKHGDRFRIGISLFVYLEREDTSKKPAAL